MSRALRRHHAARLARNRRPLTSPEMRISDNELAVRHPFDCGSRCLMCHSDKLLRAGRRRARFKAAVRTAQEEYE